MAQIAKLNAKTITAVWTYQYRVQWSGMRVHMWFNGLWKSGFYFVFGQRALYCFPFFSVLKSNSHPIRHNFASNCTNLNLCLLKILGFEIEEFFSVNTMHFEDPNIHSKTYIDVLSYLYLMKCNCNLRVLPDLVFTITLKSCIIMMSFHCLFIVPK